MICSLFRGCPFFGGRNLWTLYWQGGEQFVHCREVVHSSECPLSECPLIRVSIIRVSTYQSVHYQSVHYQRFHCFLYISFHTPARMFLTFLICSDVNSDCCENCRISSPEAGKICQANGEGNTNVRLYIHTLLRKIQNLFSFFVQCLRDVFCMGEKVCPGNLAFELRFVDENSTCGQLCVCYHSPVTVFHFQFVFLLFTGAVVYHLNQLVILSKSVLQSQFLIFCAG